MRRLERTQWAASFCPKFPKPPGQEGDKPCLQLVSTAHSCHELCHSGHGCISTGKKQFIQVFSVRFQLQWLWVLLRRVWSLTGRDLYHHGNFWFCLSLLFDISCHSHLQSNAPLFILQDVKLQHDSSVQRVYPPGRKTSRRDALERELSAATVPICSTQVLSPMQPLTHAVVPLC